MRETGTPGRDGQARAALAAFADPARPPIAGPVLVVLAHPDDETLGCGALLARLGGLHLLHVTDGAPRSGGDARAAGFADPAAYAAARRAELRAALARGAVPDATADSLDVPDQEASLALVAITARLLPRVAAAALVVTHAFEGGHPDHDATAFAVRAAARLAGGRPVVEMPFYRAGPDGAWLRQEFDGREGVVLRLSAEERARKAAMIAAHRSQAATLQGFGVADERFRAAEPVAFDALPNGGRVLYDGFGWPLDGRRFAGLARDAAARLGLDPCL